MGDWIKILGLFEAALAVALLVAAVSPVVCRLLKRRIEIHADALDAFYASYHAAEEADRAARAAKRAELAEEKKRQKQQQDAGPALWTRPPQAQEGQG